MITTENDKNKAGKEEVASLEELWSKGLDLPAVNLAINDILHNVGIPSSLLGYLFLRTAIEMSYINIEAVVGGVTKILYPTIALLYNSTSNRVERAIRHAIETGWSRAKVETMEEVFSYSYSDEKGKPTNSEFIANIADYLDVRYRKEREEFRQNNPEMCKALDKLVYELVRNK